MPFVKRHKGLEFTSLHTSDRVTVTKLAVTLPWQPSSGEHCHLLTEHSRKSCTYAWRLYVTLPSLIRQPISYTGSRISAQLEAGVATGHARSHGGEIRRYGIIPQLFLFNHSFRSDPSDRHVESYSVTFSISENFPA
eukprot:sb/3474545/